MPIMGLKMADLVREACEAGGTGALVLDGAATGYRRFDDAVGRGVPFPYAILGVAYPGEWESGVGMLDGAGKLVRNPAASSAGGAAAVNFTPGEKLVVLTPHAGWLSAVEDHGHDMGKIDGLDTALAGKQGASVVLGALAALSPSADRLAYWSGPGTAALTQVSAAGRGLIGEGDAGAMRSRLGLVIGADVQAHNSDLAAIAALTTSGFGRGVLTQASAAAVRSYIGAGTSSTSGTVTSVAGSGGTTGLSMNGGPVTGAGTLTLGGTLAIGSGGTGSTTAAGARAAIGLGTAATQNIGTSGATIPLLNSGNNWSAGQSVFVGGGNALQFIGSGGQFVGFNGRNNYASATQSGVVYWDAANENGIAYSHLFQTVNPDGGSEIRCGITPPGSRTVDRRMDGWVQHASAFHPGADNGFSCGASTHRWSVVYAATGTISTSDAREKQDRAMPAEPLLKAWGDVRWITYRWREAVTAKGDAARVHMGLIAQDVRDAIDARMGTGTAVRYGLLCRDEMTEGEERWGLRYDQCFALEAAWQRRRMDLIEARIDALSQAVIEAMPEARGHVAG